MLIPCCSTAIDAPGARSRLHNPTIIHPTMVIILMLYDLLSREIKIAEVFQNDAWFW
jgi:hypothetical protein